MRNLILILVLTLTALASASAAGMSLDHAGGMAPGTMASMDGHDCPSCPETTGDVPSDHGACSDCAACGSLARETPQPTASPIDMTYTRMVNLRVTAPPTGRVDTDDPPPPRA